MEVVIEGLTFSSKFDSGNLARVESITPTKQGKNPSNVIPDLEFNLWTKKDAADTEYQNGFRSWFFFSVKGNKQPLLIRFNIQNLNRHSKVFTNYMYPVYMISEQLHWQKIKDKPVFMDIGENAVLSFVHRVENLQRVYFALCYPYPYKDIMNFLSRIDVKFSSIGKVNFNSEDVYYYRECLCHSLEGRSVDLITITSTWGISRKREPRLENLFPNSEVPRPHCFPNKKVIFITARVHPAETSSSFVLDGIITSLINKEDPGAALLRKKFIFKLIPVLNPDGVVRGHYRTDSRGVNLNRVYQNPSLELHPTIYATCKIIHYYHGKDVRNDAISVEKHSEESQILVDGQVPCPEKEKEVDRRKERERNINSGIFLYLDLHSHASRKGFFLYGNSFPDIEDCVEAKVFAKLMELNCKSFAYNSCDFSETSMHLKDKMGNGTREGAGRVWVMQETGINCSYTFEAHYNTGQVETCIPRRGGRLESKHWISYTPSEFSTPTYEGVGRAILQSILDLNGPNTWSRLSSSPLKSLTKIRESLRKEFSEQSLYKRPIAKVLKPAVRVAGISSGGMVTATVTGTIPKTKGGKRKITTQTPQKTDLSLKETEPKELRKENIVNESSIPEVVAESRNANSASLLAVCDNLTVEKEEEKSSFQVASQQLEVLKVPDSNLEDTIPEEDIDCCPPL